MNKKLKMYEVFAILLGSIIGWGCFMLPGQKFLPSAGVINTSLGLFLGTITIIIIERSYRFMMQQDINEGGEFSYTLKFLGADHGFIVGWFLSLAYISLIPLNALAFPLVFDKLSPGILNFGYMYNIAGQDIYFGNILVSLIIILFFMFFNIRGIKNSSKIQTIIIFLLVISVIVVSIGMFTTADFSKFKENYISNYHFDFGEIAMIFAITPFLYIGFDAIPQLINDMHISRRQASNIAMITLVVGMLTYILMNLCTGLVYSPTEASNLNWALGSAVWEKLGIAGFIFLIIALAGAVSGGINGFMICATKLGSSMTKAKMLPNIFAKQTKNNTNYLLIIAISSISFIGCFFGRNVIGWIVDMCSFGAAVTYFYVCLVTFIKALKVGTKIVAVFGMAFSALFICLLLIPASPAFLSKEALICLGIWIIVGIIFFIRLKIIKKIKEDIEVENSNRRRCRWGS